MRHLIMVRFGGLEARRAGFRPAVAGHWVAILALSCGGRADRILVGADDDPRGGNGGEDANAAGAPGTPGSGGDATGAAGAGESGGGGTTATACAPLAPRLIRLTFPQVLNGVESLAGKAIADELRAELGFGASSRAFPPLTAAEEGSFVNDSVLEISDRIAERTAARMAENMEGVTGCSPDGEIACVETYLTEFAALAYRRDVDETDVQEVLTVTAEAEGLGATPAEVLRTGVHLVLSSPSFLYRTEFGSTTSESDEVELSAGEIANALSFFLRDAPPDAALVAAAEDGSLSTPEGFARETSRLLESAEVRANLARSMAELLGRANIETAVSDDPALTSELRNAAAYELDSFVGDHLFSGPLGELLTSRRTRVNAELADLYGVAFPPDGEAPDESGFASVSLPEGRSGFLSRAGFLLGAGGPVASASSAYRGSHVDRVVVCGPRPPAHAEIEGLEFDLSRADTNLAGASERERTEYRSSFGVCAGCHLAIDPYGMALAGFDPIGRSRSTDEVGEAIDDEVTLPDEVGGGVVKGAAEMAAAIEASGAFEQCTAQAYVRYALAEDRPELDLACEVELALSRSGDSGDASFSRIVAAIAEATAFRPRSRAAARRLP